MSELQGPVMWGNGIALQRTDAFVVYGKSAGCVPGKATSAVVVLGAFDGVHVGHRALVKNAIDEARSRLLPCVVVTFDPDPANVVGKGSCGSRLLRTADRCNGLLSLGADYIVVYSFTPELASLAPRAFVESVLCQTICPASIHVGQNFRFGHRGAGDVNTLQSLGHEYGFGVHATKLLHAGGAPVSASRIRELLGGGMLGEANDLLGRSHWVRGEVVHGRGEGTAFGFPTANVVFPREECLPKDGVYACYVIKDNSAWPAAANVGAPPSFCSSKEQFLEANLIGFSGDLYGAEVTVTFEAWLRDSRKFDSLEELKDVVLKNIEWVKRHLGTNRLEVQH